MPAKAISGAGSAGYHRLLVGHDGMVANRPLGLAARRSDPRCELALHDPRRHADERKTHGNRTGACRGGQSRLDREMGYVACRTHRVVELGILDQAELFPAHRYRISEHADKRNKAYVIRLREAAKICGLA